MLATFFTPFLLSSLNIAIPYITKDIKLTPNDMTWLSISFLISSTIGVIPMGKIADKYGRVKIFKIGFISFSILTLICGLSITKEQLIFFRFLQGFSASMIFSTAIAIISSAFQKGERGKYIGLSASSVYLGLTSGPLLGGIITEYFKWRSIFIFVTIISIPVIILIHKNIKQEWEDENIKINTKFMFFYLISISILIYASTNIIKNKFLFPFSILLFILYTYLEYKQKENFINIKEIGLNQIFIFSNLSAFFHYSATFSISFLLSLYLQYIKGLNPKDSGLILFTMPFFMMILSPIIGKLSDKKDPSYFTSIGILISIIGLFPLIIIEKLNLILIIIFLSIIGFGFALFSSPNTNQVMSSLNLSSYSLGSAILSTMRIMGQNFSMSITNAIFYFYLKNKDINLALNDFLKSFKISILISLFLLLIALYFSIKKIKTTR